jgi:hypothetical protein
MLNNKLRKTNLYIYLLVTGRVVNHFYYILHNPRNRDTFTLHVEKTCRGFVNFVEVRSIRIIALCNLHNQLLPNSRERERELLASYLTPWRFSFLHASNCNNTNMFFILLNLALKSIKNARHWAIFFIMWK